MNASIIISFWHGNQILGMVEQNQMNVMLTDVLEVLHKLSWTVPMSPYPNKKQMCLTQRLES